MTTFRTEFSLHLRYAKGLALFVREESLPFVPFIGLDILTMCWASLSWSM